MPDAGSLLLASSNGSASGGGLMQRQGGSRSESSKSTCIIEVKCVAQSAQQWTGMRNLWNARECRELRGCGSLIRVSLVHDLDKLRAQAGGLRPAEREPCRRSRVQTSPRRLRFPGRPLAFRRSQLGQTPCRVFTNAGFVLAHLCASIREDRRHQALPSRECPASSTTNPGETALERSGFERAVSP
jgi:hypothetical protein